MLQAILRNTKLAMEQMLNNLLQDLKVVRSGRLSPALLEDIKVSYYGASTPLKRLASLTIISPTTLQILPFDKESLGDIEVAIRAASQSYNPQNDGRTIRVTFPPMSSEQRTAIIGLLHQKGEEVKVALRVTRQKNWQDLKKMEKAGKLTEDDRYQGEEELNKLVLEYNQKIEEVLASKEKEIQSL